VKGPLTLTDWAAITDSTASSSNRDEEDGEIASDGCFQLLSLPNIRVGFNKDNSILQISPTAIQFWEKV